MKNKVYLLSHKDCGNRGCEAITRGTKTILGLNQDDIIAYSDDMEADKKIGLASEVTLRNNQALNIVEKLNLKVRLKLSRNEQLKKLLAYGYKYDHAMNQIGHSDIELSTGGDMFCYGNNEVIYINNYLNRRGIKTVLWGCSFGKENVTPEKFDTLKRFKAIIARESYSESVFNELGIKNVFRFPDPAFVLAPEKCKLPEYMNGRETVGINLSNFVGNDVGLDTIFGKNVICLIDYIISKTNFNIVLIPHVFWKGQDDRVVCEAVYNKYKDDKRVYLLNSEEKSYCQLRYIISKCRFFIGARTHAMISAYSTGVPALALGYSIKAHGIAKDLGLSSKLVLDWKKIERDNSLTEAFKYLVNSEHEIKKIYKNNLSEYIASAYGARKVIEMIKEH